MFFSGHQSSHSDVRRLWTSEGGLLHLILHCLSLHRSLFSSQTPVSSSVKNKTCFPGSPWDSAPHHQLLGTETTGEMLLTSSQADLNLSAVRMKCAAVYKHRDVLSQCSRALLLLQIVSDSLRGMPTPECLLHEHRKTDSKQQHIYRSTGTHLT